MKLFNVCKSGQWLCVFLALSGGAVAEEKPFEVSGIYPHLAMFNNEGECGTGAVVPWAGRLWAITYGPHCVMASSDKLYEITPALGQIIRPESVGSTNANRFIHKESGQLVIGRHFIDEQGTVRTVRPEQMPGRLTATSRGLQDPAGSVLLSTMEDALYSVDVKTLKVTCFIADRNAEAQAAMKKEGVSVPASKLPGYHGKGMYTGQGRVILANNGEHGPKAESDPATVSGALGEWTAPGQDWKLVRRNQFTEVTGPGGINGSGDAEPVWTVGWDFRSLIFMCLDNGVWHSYRLPKGSHSYDGAHGWNTEWPRIRDIGEPDLLMTMHGTFWKFPKNFSATVSAGIAPRSNYLKVIPDFCEWQGRVVFACDDNAKNEFLNKRKAKGNLIAAGQSQSNLWFVNHGQLDQFGPLIGRGAVWLRDKVKAEELSDPYLFTGYDYRSLYLLPEQGGALGVDLEIDAAGDGKWMKLRTEEVPAGGKLVVFKPEERGAWIRLKPSADCGQFTAMFQYANADRRDTAADGMFSGIAARGDLNISGGLLHARGDGKKTLRLLSYDNAGGKALYDMGADMKLRKVDAAADIGWMEQKLAIPAGVLVYDEASVLYVDEKGRWRLPRGDRNAGGENALGLERICREVSTERDLFNAGGTFYELPAENAGGAAKMRPITTHNRYIKDYAGYRGMMIVSGLRDDAPASGHIVRSDDGKAALWVGAIDDLWKFGKPRGFGGPWKNSEARAGVASDPYLMTGYDKKTLTLSQQSGKDVNVKVEVDITGTGVWFTQATLRVKSGGDVEYRFPDGFAAYWVRLTADTDCNITGQLVYN